MEDRVRWYHRIGTRGAIFILTAILISAAAGMAAVLFLSERQVLLGILDQASFIESPLTGDEADRIARCIPGSRLLILDQDGTVLQDSSRLKNGERDSTYIDAEKKWLREDGYRLYQRSLLDPFGQKTGQVRILISDKEVAERARILGTPFLIVYLFILAILLLLVCLHLRSDMQALDDVREWLAGMAAGHRKLPPEMKRQDELQDIVDAVGHITQDLREMDSSRNTFVSNVTHELKTPLSSMKVLTEALLLQSDAPVSLYREFLSDINAEIDRENSIINDLLTLIRMDDQEKGLNLGMYSLKALTERVLRTLKPLADERGITLDLDCIGEPYLQCDEMKLTLAISNLVENAIKYNVDHGSVSVTIDANIRYARILIRDTGIGIAEEHFPKLFDRFYRADAARDRGTGGTGLGLSIVRQIILLHHGTISVDSKVDEGTLFLISLPVKQESRQEGPEHA